MKDTDRLNIQEQMHVCNFLQSAHPTVKREGSLVINSTIELNALQRDILEKTEYFTTRTTQNVDLTLLLRERS